MVEYKLTRKKIKNINLRISKSGEVLVSAPYLCPKFVIDNFVCSKEEWILKKKESISAQNLQTFTKEQRLFFKNKLQVLIPKWEKITGLHCKSFRIKDMRTRWGSCNPRTGNININIQLMNKPEICLEYVILHELTHLKVANHSKEFYSNIEKFMPEYKKIRKLLNEGELR